MSSESCVLSSEASLLSLLNSVHCCIALMVPSDPAKQKLLFTDNFPKSTTSMSDDCELTGSRIPGEPACSSNKRRVDRVLSSGT